MRIELQETHIRGVLSARVPLLSDQRGQFGRLFCMAHSKDLGDFQSIQQVNQSVNRKRGTIRGMHFQRSPYAESKWIVCVRGSVVDAVVDLRAGSPTFGQHVLLRLEAKEGGAILVPKGCAHGFQTLEDHSQLIYFHDQMYEPSAEGGISALDPALAIKWPLPPQHMSERDRALPRLEDCSPLILDQ